MDASNDLKFIPYGLISVAGKDTMKHIIMQQNEFIEEMSIVTIQDIDIEKEDEVKDLFSKSLSFTGMERRRKSKEGRYLLITTPTSSTTGNRPITTKVLLRNQEPHDK